MGRWERRQTDKKLDMGDGGGRWVVGSWERKQVDKKLDIGDGGGRWVVGRWRGGRRTRN